MAILSIKNIDGSIFIVEEAFPHTIGNNPLGVNLYSYEVTKLVKCPNDGWYAAKSHRVTAENTMQAIEESEEV